MNVGRTPSVRSTTTFTSPRLVREANDAMDETADELDREVVLGTPTTVGDVWIRAIVHIHEHLGQSIAYARANEVVPPWSR